VDLEPCHLARGGDTHTLCSLQARFRVNLYVPEGDREESMARAAALPTPEFRQALLETYVVNDRMNQLILEHLDPHAWRAKPPGNTRTIAAIFVHTHNIRRKWLRLSAPHLPLPAQFDCTRCRSRPPTDCGSGKNSGSSADSLIRADLSFVRTREKSQRDWQSCLFFLCR